MPIPKTLHATYRIVTPMFLGGADQTPNDGIRPSSVKGALRFWWRALNWGRFRDAAGCDETALMLLHAEEGRLFGLATSAHGGGGQGCFLLRIEHRNLTAVCEDTVHPHLKPTRKVTRNRRQEIDPTHLAAARYLGYGLMVAFTSTNRDTGVTKYAGQLERACLKEDQEFTVKLIFQRNVEASVREALIAWGLLGGLGSRSRHGMGSVALISLKVDGDEPWTVPTDEESYAEKVRALFISPVPPPTASPLPVTKPPFSAFWEQSRIDCLLTSKTPYAVLDGFGNAMLMYRSWGKTSMGNRLPGGVSEKRFENDHSWYRDPSWAANNPNFHPERVEFGLPHNYHKVHHHVVSENHERRSSPLLFHVHPIGDQFIGVSIYLPGRFLPVGEQIKANNRLVPAAVRWTVIQDFLDGKVGNPPPPGAKARFPGKKPILPCVKQP